MSDGKVAVVDATGKEGWVDLRVMTYNVHACRGRDGRVDVGRVAAVIDQQDPDIACLQELDVFDARSGSADQPTELARRTGRAVHFQAARSAASSHFGNATLCRHPFDLVTQGGLPVLRDECRAAHCLRVALGKKGWVHLVNTHLSIRMRERFQQIRAILADEAPAESARDLFRPLIAPFDHLVLCGDLNAGGWSPVARWLRGKLRDVQESAAERRGSNRKQCTWPSSFPLLRLDHIWVGQGMRVRRAFVPQNPLCSVASDHLPLVADLSVVSESAS